MKMPEGWDVHPKKVSNKLTASTKLKARIDMSEDIAGKGLCPECGKPMSVVFANNIKCYCCMEDRIVLPMPNSK